MKLSNEIYLLLNYSGVVVDTLWDCMWNSANTNMTSYVDSLFTLKYILTV